MGLRDGVKRRIGIVPRITSFVNAVEIEYYSFTCQIRPSPVFTLGFHSTCDQGASSVSGLADIPLAQTVSGPLTLNSQTPSPAHNDNLTTFV